MAAPVRFRVATYNIHKCRGFDRKTSPARITAILRALDADVLCLQEVLDVREGRPLLDQAREIAAALPEYAWSFGENRKLHGGGYGNMTLTRLPLLRSHNYDLTREGREPRGCLRSDVRLREGLTLHIFNVHLGTGLLERRYQVRRLVSGEVLESPELVRDAGGLAAPRLVLGDFNEWTRGLTTKLLTSSFATFQPRHGLRYPRTFPGMLPLLTLDHCYYDPPLRLEQTRLWRTKAALVASDHLPLLADFSVADEGSIEESADEN